jgi:hypothetical protein
MMLKVMLFCFLTSYFIHLKQCFRDRVCIIYVIPDGYLGRVTIFEGQSEELAKKEYFNRCQVVRISSTGVGVSPFKHEDVTEQNIYLYSSDFYKFKKSGIIHNEIHSLSNLSYLGQEIDSSAIYVIGEVVGSPSEYYRFTSYAEFKFLVTPYLLQSRFLRKPDTYYDSLRKAYKVCPIYCNHEH